MIPEALHLRNFLSHRETLLDLRGVHLASLVGENGAGKSALLDGITWAAWGRSRAPYGHDEDLVYHGEDSMEVEFTFRMPYHGGETRRCRILRRREQRGRRSTSSVLDFQMETDLGWRTLTSDSIRETQARIIQHLGLDYDTFINSAYLRQGHADEFTVQTPTERKRVLSTILGLDRWNEYQERAKRRLSTAQGQMKEVNRRLEETEQELARRPEYEAALAAAEVAEREAEARLREVQAQVDELTRVQQQALAIQSQIASLDQRIQQETARLHQLEQDTEEHQGRKAYYESMVGQAEAIEATYRDYQAAVSEERAWGDKLSQAARLQEEKARCEQAIAEAREAAAQALHAAEQAVAQARQAIDAERARLASDLRDLHGQIALLEERIPGEETAAALQAAQAELARLDAQAHALEAAREAAQAAEVERTRLIERNHQLREVMNKTKEDLEALEAADESQCPLCRQALTPEHHDRLLADIQAEGKSMGDEYRANAARIQALQAERDQQQAQVKDLERALRGRDTQAQHVTRLQQQVEQGEEARQRSETLRAQAATVEQQLADDAFADDAREALRQHLQAETTCRERWDAGRYALEARATLQQTLAHLAELGYDAAAHQDIKARIASLSAAETDYRELEKARIGIEKESETLKRLALEVDAQHARIRELEAERTAQHAALADLQPTLAQAAHLGQALNAAREREATARQQVGAARQNLAALETLSRRSERLRAEHATLAEQVALLTELRDAFGVNGIPAMIIEHTLPELESEANHLLQRLTNGRMHVRFDTQRETKSGTLRETLDIIISDEKGTRPYENFSGGEQFRVNFAIRVALSRLLAQRAGVRLRSLFVDEGFGALDADGRRRLVEAVKAVQSEFDLVLVITHINELREAFPTQIQVTKTEAGSMVEVV